MRSGNGRHRRPRQVPAIVVTAGVTGSALALPLLAATNASAADTSTWDKVAECESGGSWSANYGSGQYGGLQFSQDEWQSAGGSDFAKRPDLASRSQQIAVAERILASQGPQAWPLCAASAGLEGQSPAAVVDPGLPGGSAVKGPAPTRPDEDVPSTGKGKPSTDFGAPTPAPSPSATPSFVIPDGPLAPSLGLPVMPSPDEVTPTPTAPGTPTAPVDPNAPTTPPGTPGQPPVTPADPAAPATPGATTDPTAPATQGAPAAPGTSTGPTAPPVTAAEGNGKHRGAPATETPAASDAASAPSYTVQAGDSLVTIADAKGVKGGWKGLYAANEQVIGGNADLIKPGQNLDLTAQ
ncbi:transglycosylase family protein [Streptomyces sp. NBC_00190]|uniref:LysM peptidoglycan-binding domain-containing protein n=1 Tax=unclassified Streptomyces TaxID=2593676 RepID=UPI002E2DBC92|nr:transglycosylase family protein [Streptomyces sp. NBC_00190]WSZ40720.1 transglycosylase family protein [Streptomyces sp. NBC_00868]